MLLLVLVSVLALEKGQDSQKIGGCRKKKERKRIKQTNKARKK